jgi:hypothetical protein
MLAARPPKEWPPATTPGPARAAKTAAARSARPRGSSTASAATPRARRPWTWPAIDSAPPNAPGPSTTRRRGRSTGGLVIIYVRPPLIIGVVVLRVTAVEPVSSHEVRLTFNDGLVREVDMAPMMWGELGEALKDPDFFRRVRVDEEARSITWPNGFEPDPDVLHGDHPPAMAGGTEAPKRGRRRLSASRPVSARRPG